MVANNGDQETPLLAETHASKQGGGSVWPRITVFLAACFATAVVLISAAIAIAALWGVPYDMPDPTTDDGMVSKSDSDFLLPDGRPVLRKTVWETGGMDGTSPSPESKPASTVVIKDTAGPACAGIAQCAPLLRSSQVRSNFLVDRKGEVYEGRGWETGCSVELALLGNYSTRTVSAKTAAAVSLLLELGVQRGKVAPQYQLLAYSQVADSPSPGRYALEAMAGWPNRCLQNCTLGVQCIQEQSSTTTVPPL